MAEAGWSRGADGMYRSQSGQPIDLEVRAGNPPLVREGSAIAALFKAAGVETSVAVGSDGEIRFTFPGLEGAPLRDTQQDLAGFISSQAGTEANRWSGNNRGRYSNAAFDQLYSRSLVTLDPGERQGLVADLWKMEAEDTASIHVFYDMAQQTIVMRKGVHGPGPVSSKQLVVAWNIHTWDMD